MFKGSEKNNYDAPPLLVAKKARQTNNISRLGSQQRYYSIASESSSGHPTGTSARSLSPLASPKGMTIFDNFLLLTTQA
jgi:hypothetical protein